MLVLLLALGLLSGCGGNSGEDADVNGDLHERIQVLGGQDAYPVVSLDLFFQGNDVPASFAPNLEPHPGIDRFYSVFKSNPRST
jgi:hypothetical protein